MSKTLIAGGRKFVVENYENLFDETPLFIFEDINPSKKVVVMFGMTVDKKDVVSVAENLKGITCLRLVDLYAGYQCLVTDVTIETFNGLVADKVPSDLALSAAMSFNGDNALPNAISIIRETGASIQIDNATMENSIEIFLRGVDIVGVESMKKLFRVFGSSIINQRRALEIATKITDKSVESFSMVPEESLTAVSNFLSVTKDETAAEVIVDAINDVNHDRWAFIGKISEELSEDNLEEVSALMNISKDLLSEIFEEFRLTHKYDHSFGYSGKENDVFALLLVTYGIDNMACASENIREVLGSRDFCSVRVAQYVAIVSHIGRYDDPDTPVDLILDLAGLPDIGYIY